MGDFTLETILVFAALGVFVIAMVVTSVVAGYDMRSFLASTPKLRDDEDFDAYRRVVARNMYAAVALLALLALTFLMVIVAVILGFVHWLPMVLFILPASGIMGTAGMWTKSIEKKVQRIPVADPTMIDERDAIVEVWHSKMFPDW